jgi:hypothetical protein
MPIKTPDRLALLRLRLPREPAPELKSDPPEPAGVIRRFFSLLERLERPLLGRRSGGPDDERRAP